MKINLKRKIIYTIGGICALIIGFGLYFYFYLDSIDKLALSHEQSKIGTPRIRKTAQQPEAKNLDFSTLVTNEMINQWIDPIINKNVNQEKVKNWIKEIWDPPKVIERLQENAMNSVQAEAMVIVREKMKEISTDLEAKGQTLSMEEKQSLENFILSTIQARVKTKTEDDIVAVIPKVMPELIRPIMQGIMLKKRDEKMMMRMKQAGEGGPPKK